MSQQKTYTVNNRRQLVDLNGDSKNFDLTFTCTSKDGTSFDVLVVDQATLDSTPTLQYKKANGTISGNIVADKDVYQNYFLVLKADKPCEVTVKTVKKDISPNLPPPRNTQSSLAQRPPALKPPTRLNKSNWKLIAIVAIVLGGGILLYYLYNQKKNTTVEGPSSVPLSPATSVASNPAPAPSPSPALRTSLLDRLKTLDMSM